MRQVRKCEWQASQQEAKAYLEEKEAQASSWAKDSLPSIPKS